MSRINIQRTIDNIRSQSNIYTPIVEAIVNSIDSILEKGISKGKIEIQLKRATELEFEDSIPPVTGISIKDNGLGFNKSNRDSFDTFYSELKKSTGGKGFGRFMFAKYFIDVSVKSRFKDNGEYYDREFKFGKKYEIIENEKVNKSDQKGTWSIVHLNNIKNQRTLDKNLETISRKILEKILVFFIRDDFKCPTIIIKDSDGAKIVLNDYLNEKNEINQIASKEFQLKCRFTKELTKFQAKVFKLYYTGNQKSRIILTANNRAVTEVNLSKYVPEFEDDFFEENTKGTKRNYIIRTYVISDYLDEKVNIEREQFDFDKEVGDQFSPHSKREIEDEATKSTTEIFQDDIRSRFEKKTERIRGYVNQEAPWHQAYFSDLDLSKIPYNIKEEEIETELQKIKFEKEQETKSELKRILSNTDELNQEQLSEAINKITEIGKSDLAHYVFNRKMVLDAFTQVLKRREDGKGELEKDVHNMLFPMGKDTETIDYEDHNLWILDERLVFSEYIASDKKIGTKADALKEPDLVVFGKKASFRNGSNEFSNPLTIFEFKRPKRTAYKAEDDPVLQLGRYLDDIKAGKYEMPEGLEPINVNDNTPIYAYVVCTVNNKIHEFAKNHQLTRSPDKKGYFGFHRGYGMYIEIIDYTKLLRDASLRNKIFFKKLQIE